MGDAFRLKDGHPKHMQSCVVLSITCNADYIGKTSRHVKRRFEEHKLGSQQRDETYDSACFNHEKTYIIIKLITKILKF